MISSRPRASRAVGALAVAMVASACAAAEADDPGLTTILRGEAHSAEGAISIETADWTYSVPLDGVQWVGADDIWHDEGRPDCLQPMDRPAIVRFAAVEVTVEGTTWRPVVWVDCRP